jgi:hypothetical protein
VAVTTAHKILIGSSIAFFAGYGLWELSNFARAGEATALAASVLALGAAIGLGFYLRSFIRSLEKRRAR